MHIALNDAFLLIPEHILCIAVVGLHKFVYNAHRWFEVSALHIYYNVCWNALALSLCQYLSQLSCVLNYLFRQLCLMTVHRDSRNFNTVSVFSMELLCFTFHYNGT